MLNELMPSPGVMEGDGAYNRHAYVPASGAALALPLLESAARSVPLDAGDYPIVIADYGSSQGKNSLAPMRTAIGALRSRLGTERPILVCHVDQPANDFNSLFEVLDSDPDRYDVGQPNIFSCAIGRSFYGNVLPPGSVSLGWSSYAVVWLSRIPRLVPGHFIALRSTAEVRTEFQRQGAEDWKSFLSLRASELRPGGRLVVVLPGLDDGGVSGFEDLFDHANAVLAEMVDDGTILPEERARMVLGACPRRKCDLLAPFAHDRQFGELVVEHCETYVLPDAAWIEYERDGNKEALASKHALFFRSVFTPSLASALARGREARTHLAFGDRLESGLKQRLSSEAAALHSFAQVIVLARRERGSF
jgi:hypothetical protein